MKYLLQTFRPGKLDAENNIFPVSAKEAIAVARRDNGEKIIPGLYVSDHGTTTRITRISTRPEWEFMHARCATCGRIVNTGWDGKPPLDAEDFKCKNHRYND